MENDNPYESPRTQPADVPTPSRRRNKTAREPDYRRWLAWGVILPAIVLLCALAIVAGIWRGQIALTLGSCLGGIFLGYLLALTLAAVFHKILAEKQSQEKNTNVGNRQP